METKLNEIKALIQRTEKILLSDKENNNLRNNKLACEYLLGEIDRLKAEVERKDSALVLAKGHIESAVEEGILHEDSLDVATVIKQALNKQEK